MWRQDQGRMVETGDFAVGSMLVDVVLLRDALDRAVVSLSPATVALVGQVMARLNASHRELMAARIARPDLLT